MHESLIALLVFACLGTTSLLFLGAFRKIPPHRDPDDMNEVVRNIASIFILMTSLVLGLMINSARNSYDSLDQEVHSLSSQLVGLDQVLRAYGDDADPARQRLKIYADAIVNETWRAPTRGRGAAEQALAPVYVHIHGLTPADGDQHAMRVTAGEMLEKIAEQRWVLHEEATDSATDGPFELMIVAWLVVIFASLAYRAPRNILSVIILLVPAALISATFYLVIDMERPFSGLIMIQPSPLEEAISEMRN
jgi:hypothetical protein